MRQINDWKTIANKKNIDFVDNNNITEEQIGSKKLHFNKRGNSILAKNILKYLRDSNWKDDILNCGMKHDECKSKVPSESVNGISVRSIRVVRKKNLKRIILGHLNINSNQKQVWQVDQINGNVDIMFISETKLDQSFPNGQFKIPGYALPCRLDRNQFGGGIMVFVKEDMPSRVLSLNKSIDSLFIELNFRKKKWLLCCIYNPNRNNISNHLDLLRRSLDLYSAEYENLLRRVWRFFAILMNLKIWLKMQHVIRIKKP